MTTRELMRKVRRIEIRTRGIVSEMFSGEYSSAFRGRGIEFSEVREYVPGDDVRAIDWNVSAREGKPYIKLFEEERELLVMLLVDVSASGDFGSVAMLKRELAAELAAVLAFSALRNQDKVGLILFSDKVETYIPAKKGTSHALRMIRDLLAFKPESRGTDLSEALNYLLHTTRKRATVFLVSDFQQPGPWQDAARIVARKHDLIALHLVDPRERLLPPGGLLPAEDPETGDVVWLDLADKGFRRRYFQAREQQREEVARFCARSNIDRVEIDLGEPEQPYLRPLQRFFKAREARR
ncbi:DUF58 domain-containing protein [bacterium]|nr:DUF58 domain-containing protein [bacterium]